jgi:hypothetical protein
MSETKQETKQVSPYVPPLLAIFEPRIVNADGDVDTDRAKSARERQQWITMFTPKFVFDKDEKYWPCNVETYIKYCSLWRKSSDGKGDTLCIAEGKVTVDDLAKTGDDKDSGNKYYLNINEKFWGGERENLDNVPVFTHVRDQFGYIEVIYFIFFAYNGNLDVAGCFKAGAHQADIEHVTMRIDRTTKKLLGVYYSAHATVDGAWVTGKDIKFDDGKDGKDGVSHPLVYVAKNSHAMYSAPGTWARFCCFANDSITVDTEHTPTSWIPQVFVKADTVSDAPVLRYKGNWGNDGVSNFPDKISFSTGEVLTSNTWWRRMFCCLCDATCCLTDVTF